MRLLTLPALALILAQAAVGCGAISSKSSVNISVGNQLTIYSSLPLQGPEAANSQAIIYGEKLALAQAGGRVGPFRISYVSLDDASPTSGVWNPGVTSSDAKAAAQDNGTIAYLGDYNSGASAVSLPLINAADILQISPGSPYVGLTSSRDAGQDEPGRFYVNGVRTFGRLVPGDLVEARAQALLMRHLGVHTLYVINDQNPFESALADLVQGDAQALGINVVANDGVSIDSADFSGEAAKVAGSGAQAVFFSGGGGPGTVRLWQALATADSALKLLGTHALVDPVFTAQLGASAPRTYLTTPLLPHRLYPPAAQRFFGLYHDEFGAVAPVTALYGYEAMSLALLAVHNAGAQGNIRGSVVTQFFRIHDRDSVLGRYSIQPDGDTTLSDFAVDRVVGGRAVFSMLMHAPAAAA